MGADHAQLCRQLAEALDPLVSDLTEQLRGHRQDSLVLLGAADCLLQALESHGVHVTAEPAGRPVAERWAS